MKKDYEKLTPLEIRLAFTTVRGIDTDMRRPPDEMEVALVRQQRDTLRRYCRELRTAYLAARFIRSCNDAAPIQYARADSKELVKLTIPRGAREKK